MFFSGSVEEMTEEEEEGEACWFFLVCGTYNPCFFEVDITEVPVFFASFLKYFCA